MKSSIVNTGENVRRGVERKNIKFCPILKIIKEKFLKLSMRNREENIADRSFENKFEIVEILNVLKHDLTFIED